VNTIFYYLAISLIASLLFELIIRIWEAIQIWRGYLVVAQLSLGGIVKISCEPSTELETKQKIRIIFAGEVLHFVGDKKF